MKRGSNATLLLVVIAVYISILHGTISAQSSAFTYQGKLNDGAASANGQYDLSFKLFDLDTAGTQVGTEQIVENVQVTNGIFTVELDFQTTPFVIGAANYIEIAVRPGTSTGTFTTLAPRQRLTSSPYALQSAFAGTAVNADNALNATNAANAQNADAVGGTPAKMIIKEGDLRLSDFRQPLPGNSSYVQINPTAPQSGGFDILGNAKVRSTLDVQGQTVLRSNVSVLGTLSGNGSGLTDLNAANISGLGSLATVTPTGTADSSTFLRGDGRWSKAPIFFMATVTRGFSLAQRNQFFAPIGAVSETSTEVRRAWTRIPRACTLGSLQITAYNPSLLPIPLHTFSIYGANNPNEGLPTALVVTLQGSQTSATSSATAQFPAGSYMAINEIIESSTSNYSVTFYISLVCE